MKSLLTFCLATLFSISFGQVETEPAPEIDVTPQEDLPHVLGTSNFYQLVINSETNTPISEKGWFIKFYAPWCGHCKRLGPMWDELHTVTKDKLNVGKVDCTSDDGKGLCSHYEIRGYPSLLFFPPAGAPKPVQKDDQDETLKESDSAYYKFQGPRNLEEFIDFANGGYLTATFDEIPKQLSGWAYWSRQISLMSEDMKQEIDMVFVQIGLAKYVPSIARYILVAALFLSPVIVLLALLCCCFDEEVPEPQTLPKRVIEASATSKQNQTTPTREKID